MDKEILKRAFRHVSSEVEAEVQLQDDIVAALEKALMAGLSCETINQILCDGIVNITYIAEEEDA